MCATFTDNDIGKLVQTGNGEDVGVIAAVDGRIAHVSPIPMIDTSDPSTPSMATQADETRPIEADSVREITDDRVCLEGDLSVPTKATKPDRTTQSTISEEDPTDELAEEATNDPGAEADPRTLADRRTDAAVSADDEPRRTDAAVDPDDDMDRTDAEVDPDGS